VSTGRTDAFRSAVVETTLGVVGSRRSASEAPLMDAGSAPETRFGRTDSTSGWADRATGTEPGGAVAAAAAPARGSFRQFVAAHDLCAASARCSTAAVAPNGTGRPGVRRPRRLRRRARDALPASVAAPSASTPLTASPRAA